MPEKENLDPAEVAFFSDLQTIISRRPQRLPQQISRICGVDAAYDGDRVFAAACLFESGQPSAEALCVGRCTVPYVSGLFYLREGPFAVEAVEEAESSASTGLLRRPWCGPSAFRRVGHHLRDGPRHPERRDREIDFGGNGRRGRSGTRQTCDRSEKRGVRHEARSQEILEPGVLRITPGTRANHRERGPSLSPSDCQSGPVRERGTTFVRRGVGQKLAGVDAFRRQNQL
jgi:hypothetical protein